MRRLDIAKKHCSNWNVGKCAGWMMKSENNKLIQWIDKKYANKPCVVEEKKCEFFENEVVKGMGE